MENLQPSSVLTNRRPYLNEKGVINEQDRERLLDRIQRDEQLLSDVEPRLKEAKRRRDDLDQRRKDLNYALEQTRIQLDREEKLVQALEEQNTMLQDNLRRSGTPIHPISHCPSDVLQLIFEWAVDIDNSVSNEDGYEPDWFKTATAISQVCYQWRKITLRTPHLWSRLNIFLSDEPENIAASWALFVERVGSYPTNITIDDSYMVDVPLKALEQCRFDRVPHIRKLSISLIIDSTRGRIQPEVFHQGTNRVDSLRLGFIEGSEYDYYGTGDVFPANPIDTNLIGIICRFSTIHSLDLFGINFDSFTTDVIFPNISNIRISNSSHIPLDLVARAFPNVELAAFSDSSFGQNTIPSYTWSKVQSLQVTSEWSYVPSGFPWRKLRLPQVVVLYSKDSDNEIMDFISMHRSILHLDIGYSKEYFASIARHAPQLLSLRTVACEEICDRSEIPLENLTELFMYNLDAWQSPLTLEYFDELVRGRFLPDRLTQTEDICDTKHKYDGGGGKAAPALMILTQLLEDDKRCLWRESKFVQLAREEVSIIKRWGQPYRCHKLVWA